MADPDAEKRRAEFVRKMLADMPAPEPYAPSAPTNAHARPSPGLQPMAAPRPPRPAPYVPLPPPRPPPPGTMEPAPGGGYQPIVPVAGPGTWGVAGPLPPPVSPQERMDRMGEARPGELYASAQQNAQAQQRPGGGSIDAATLAKLDAVLNGEDTCECRGKT